MAEAAPSRALLVETMRAAYGSCHPECQFPSHRFGDDCRIPAAVYGRQSQYYFTGAELAAPLKEDGDSGSRETGCKLTGVTFT